MKSLFWEIIPAKDIKDTLWDELDDTKIKINLDKFEEKFSQVKKEPKKEPEKKAVAKKEKKTFLEADRTRMMNIVLNKIKIDALDISDAIEQYNTNTLTQDICDLLLPIMPTEAEIKEVATFNGDVLQDLAICDQFVLIISGIIGYKERIKSILFKYNYLEDYLIITKEINRVFKVFKFLKEDENLKKLLEVMLALGNYMNGGGFRGGAFGYTLASLTKFSDTKSNGYTFIDYTVKFIYEQVKDGAKIFEVLKKLKKFEKMQYQSIVEGVKQMENRWKDVQALKKLVTSKKEELLEEDKSEAFLNDFYNDAEEKIKEIKDKLEKIDKDYEDIAKFFGENAEKFPLIKFVDTFRKFYKDLFESEKKYREKMERLKKKK
jgi:diaphanous 1